jgi:hypothetical protein
MARYTIGKLGGQVVQATYSRDGQSSLPAVSITCGGRKLGTWRGSSLGPCNAQCDPNADDLAVWQALVDLPRDDAQIARSLGAHKAAISRATAPYKAYMRELVACPQCGTPTPRHVIQALDECAACSDKHAI